VKCCCLGIVDDLRRRFARLDLRAHLPQARCKRFNLLLLFSESRVEIFPLPRNCGSLLFVFSVLLEELVEQHRVHRFITNRVDLALCIAHNQVGIDLFHVLGDEAKLWSGIEINFFLVAEGDRFQCKDRFARFVHWFDIVLETLRGGYRAEASIAVYNNACACNWASTDASNKGSTLGSLYTDADRSRVARPSRIADIDVAVASGEICTGINAQGNVAAARCVVKERPDTLGRVVDAGCVVKERIKTAGRVLAAGCIASERIKTGGRVVDAGCVVKERIKTAGRVLAAGCIASERIKTGGRVAVAGCVVKKRVNTGGRVAIAGYVEIERQKSGGRIVGAGCVVLQRASTGCRVVEADYVPKERSITGGRVGISAYVAKERINTVGRVEVADCVAKERLTSGCRVGVSVCVVSESIKAKRRVPPAKCEAEERAIAPQQCSGWDSLRPAVGQPLAQLAEAQSRRA
jgi:hypothetical protein